MLTRNVYVKISPLQFCNSCPSLTKPDNAEFEIQGQSDWRMMSLCHHRHALLGEGPESVGVFSCSEGFYLEGKQSVECNVFGEWEPDLPVCKSRNILFYMDLYPIYFLSVLLWISWTHSIRTDIWTGLLFRRHDTEHVSGRLHAERSASADVSWQRLLVWGETVMC